MKSNKQARKTMSLPGSWDEYRPVNKRIYNQIVVTLDAKGYCSYDWFHKVKDFRNHIIY